jgi:hypothetical protein
MEGDVLQYGGEDREWGGAEEQWVCGPRNQDAMQCGVKEGLQDAEQVAGAHGGGEGGQAAALRQPCPAGPDG